MTRPIYTQSLEDRLCVCKCTCDSTNGLLDLQPDHVNLITNLLLARLADHGNLITNLPLTSLACIRPIYIFCIPEQ